MILYFIRHGETEWNRCKRQQGHTDIELNENGRAAAAEAAKTLKDTKFDAAFTSPLKRAKETAQIVLKGRDIPLYEDARIQEISFGVCEGDIGRNEKNEPQGRLKVFYEHPELYKAPDGGEDVKMLCDRTWDFIRDITSRKELQDKAVLVATHGAALQSMLLWIRKLPYADLWKSGLKKNCSVTVAEAKDGEIRILKEGEEQYTSDPEKK